MAQSLSWSQPALFDRPPALRLRFEALIDRQDETVVLVVEGVEFPSRKLVELHSSSPVAFPDLEEMARDLGAVFTTILRHHTGPFPD